MGPAYTEKQHSVNNPCERTITNASPANASPTESPKASLSALQPRIVVERVDVQCPAGTRVPKLSRLVLSQPARVVSTEYIAGAYQGVDRRPLLLDTSNHRRHQHFQLRLVGRHGRHVRGGFLSPHGRSLRGVLGRHTCAVCWPWTTGVGDVVVESQHRHRGRQSGHQDDRHVPIRASPALP